jgi:glycosyltransferase involved in cell wall biosynthesis
VNSEAGFAGHLVVQQRVLPTYRLAFFERLALACGRLTVVAGQPRPGEAIASAEDLQGAEWVRLGNRHWLGGVFYLCTQPELVDRLQALSPDALVLEANPRYLSNWQARQWAKASRIPVLGWGLGAEPSNWMSGWIWRRFVRGMDAMIAYSSRGVAGYRRLGVPAERVALAVNAAGPAPAEPADRAPRRQGRLHVLYVGRLQARKRLDVLLRACARLAEPPELMIVGDGPERPALESLARGRLPEVRFTGHLEGRPLEDAFGWADLFVLPGTGGLAVQQAMAHGLAVIVGEGDGTADDLVREGNGWRVAPGDVDDLTRALQAADDDPARLSEMGARSYRIVADEVNLDTMTKAFVRAVTNAAERA